MVYVPRVFGESLITRAVDIDVGYKECMLNKVKVKVIILGLYN